jgi:RHS repeat-associated protein
VHDPYGNIVSLLDADGHPAIQYRYTAFGEVETFGATINNPWGYSSKRLDPETGFHYFGRRYYAPDIGRWITPDPAGFADGLNLYAYVHNHPLAYIDPDGQFAFLLIPFAISMAIDICLPTVALAAETYLGSTMAAAFIMGMGQGYNNDYTSTNVFGEASAESYFCSVAGRVIGTCISVGPKALANAGTAIVKKGLTSAGVAIAEKSVTKIGQDVTKTAVAATASKTAKAAEQTFIKNEVIAQSRGAVSREAVDQTVSTGTRRLRPGPGAVGSHSSFRRDALTGKITHYETYIPQTNPRNPNPWETILRFDNSGTNQSHFNKYYGVEVFEPHIHDPFFPGEVRYPILREIPR